MNGGAIIGAIIFLVGLVLAIGNKSGWLVTFPFAGLITMVVGVIISKVTRDD
jgi:sugar phosphate permease